MQNKRPVCIAVVHVPTSRAYTLSRSYSVLDQCLHGVEIMGVVRKIKKEHQPVHIGALPTWARKIDSLEFNTYWMF